MRSRRRPKCIMLSKHTPFHEKPSPRSPKFLQKDIRTRSLLTLPAPYYAGALLPRVPRAPGGPPGSRSWPAGDRLEEAAPPGPSPSSACCLLVSYLRSTSRDPTAAQDWPSSIRTVRRLAAGNPHAETRVAFGLEGTDDLATLKLLSYISSSEGRTQRAEGVCFCLWGGCQPRSSAVRL